MPAGNTDPQALIDALIAFETPRVWSFLVTIFGDLARSDSDRIDGRVLTQLTDRIGIKPQAVRVALHRLRNDDWITSTKTGRSASYQLTRKGRSETLAVAPLIYSSLDQMPRGVQIAIPQTTHATEKDTLSQAGFVQLATRVFVGSAHAVAPETAWVVTTQNAPEWLRQEIVPRDWTKGFADLSAVLEAHAPSEMRPAQNDPMTDAVLRVLIVHQWRRLVLRHPHLPPSVTGPDWSGHACRGTVNAVLRQIPRPALATLRESALI